MKAQTGTSEQVSVPIDVGMDSVMELQRIFGKSNEVMASKDALSILCVLNRVYRVGLLKGVEATSTVFGTGTG